MRITISARHCEIPDPLRERARVVMERLTSRTPFAQGATVVFDEEGVTRRVEIRLRLSGGTVMVASGQAEDHRTALDRVERKVRHQLERPVARPGRNRRTAKRP